MKKVYVLNGGCIDDRYVVAVFSSKKEQRKKGKELSTQIAFIDNPLMIYGLRNLN